MSDAGVAIDVERTGPRVWQVGRAVARLLAIEIGIALLAVVAGTAMIAVFGTPANRPALTASADGEPLKTFAGIPPIAYLVQRIGGPYVCVEVLVHAGQDPHIFEPTPRQVIDLSRALVLSRRHAV